MSVTTPTFYRLTVWLPLLAPTLVVALDHGLEWRTDAWPIQKLVQILLMSLVYGGGPYALLAVWATWRIGGCPEADIKRLMFRAPLLMAAIYPPFAAAVGIVTGSPVVPFLALGALGAIVAIPLGYAYVGLVLLLREAFGPHPA